MLTSDKPGARIIAELLSSYGVRHVVTCPGSRNASLIVALDAMPDIITTVVVDERSAAFIAMGKALQSGRPVAVVCTSGSALLNIAPAASEAYYRHIPLIIISADRPKEWIDQDDSQTIRQPGALAAVVKGSFNLSDEPATDRLRFRYHERQVNDALDLALRSPRGPVHINVELDAPLQGMADYAPCARRVSVVRPLQRLSKADAAALAAETRGRNVLIVAGFMEPNQKINRAIDKFSNKMNVVILAEAQSNIHSTIPNLIQNIDVTLRGRSIQDLVRMAPDLVITIGGAILSRHIKDYLRRLEDVEQWHIGAQPYCVDSMLHLTRRIEIEPAMALPVLAGAMPPAPETDYVLAWHKASRDGAEHAEELAKTLPWSDFKAMAMVEDKLNRCYPRVNVHLSNGTAVRYFQLFDYSNIHRIDCNRGVSGIDGCTSTAIGATSVYSGMTVLITGDMSAQYDMGALACGCVHSRFRMVVLNNGGGGIFRFVKSTKNLPQLETHFAATTELPLRHLAAGLDYNYFQATTAEELDAVFDDFMAPSGLPAILNLYTSSELSAQILNDYFSCNI